MRSLIRRLQLDATKDQRADRLVLGTLAAILEDGVAKLHRAVNLQSEVDALKQINGAMARAVAEYRRMGEPVPFQ
jgi:hypothetical protein